MVPNLSYVAATQPKEFRFASRKKGIKDNGHKNKYLRYSTEASPMKATDYTKYLLPIRYIHNTFKILGAPYFRLYNKKHSTTPKTVQA